MAFDGIVVSAMVRELGNSIKGGKIEKIYQPEKDQLLFHIHNKKRFKVIVSTNSNSARISITDENIKNPVTPFNFCMLLRKHIQGGRITDIIQYKKERVIELPIETLDEMGYKVSKKLIVEIMGKHSNVILVDNENGKIIDSLKRISIDVSRERQLLSGMIYKYPPSQNKVAIEELNIEYLDKMIDFNSSASLKKQILNTVQGLSPVVAEDIADRSNSIEDIFMALNKIDEQVKNNILSPKIYFKEDKTPLDFHSVDIEILKNRCEYKSYSSLSETVEAFFSLKENSNRVKQKSVDMKKTLKFHLDKLKLKVKRISEDILEAENSEIYKLKGELLIANLHNVKYGDSQVTLNNYYNGEPINIALDKRLSPSDNAQKYFKKYSKAKTTVKEKTIQLENTKKDIEYLESVATFLENADTVDAIEDIRKELSDGRYIKKKKEVGKVKKKKIEVATFTTSDGFKFVIGRNNLENDYVTFKMASPKDLWFHTKDIPGSHIILFTERKEPTEDAIREVAEVAAFHSKGKYSENVPVDYTLAKYVKKPNGAKPGMVIFTNNSTIYVKPRNIADETKD